MSVWDLCSGAPALTVANGYPSINAPVGANHRPAFAPRDLLAANQGSPMGSQFSGMLIYLHHVFYYHLVMFSGQISCFDYEGAK